MKLKLESMALASLLAAGANAGTIDWGAHGPLELGAAPTPIGAFDDFYLFSLFDNEALISTTVANNLTGVLGIDAGAVSLFKVVGPTNVLEGTYAFSGFSGDSSFSFPTLSAGNYFYEVTGIGTGTMGGFYSITSTVPEPHTLALCLGALVGIGFMLSRRQD